MEVRTEEGKIIVHVEPELEPVMPQFFENQANMVRSLKAALASEDYETMERLGHSMKGYGGGYGFDTITEIGGALEDAAKERAAPELSRRIGEMEEYLVRVEVVYLEG